MDLGAAQKKSGRPLRPNSEVGPKLALSTDRASQIYLSAPNPGHISKQIEQRRRSARTQSSNDDAVP